MLCDLDIVLLMFSPTGRPTVFHGGHRCIGDVIAKFALLNPQERRKRCWANIDRIENTKHLEHLEESLKKSIRRVQIHKEHFRKNQLMSLECTTTQRNRDEGNCITSDSTCCSNPVIDHSDNNQQPD